MTQTKKLDQVTWLSYLGMFSKGNRGRMITIEVEDMVIGDQALTERMPLLAIDYDPVNKGDDLVVSTGVDAVNYSHTISAPDQIFELQDDNGKVVSLEVIDRNGARTIIGFKP